MRSELLLRFDYGSIVPWVRRLDGGIVAIGGPDAVVLRSIVPTHGEDFTTVADFEVGAGQELPFVPSYFPSHEPLPLPIDAHAACEVTAESWRDWIGRCSYGGDCAQAVRRSLLTLKALTFAPTGGIVAAPTTSLPEQLGGVRNWDYRFCWLRDAAFTLDALLNCGYIDEAKTWREWLLRAAAGRPQDLHIMYGLQGERRLAEYELQWLPGYEGAVPARSSSSMSMARRWTRCTSRAAKAWQCCATPGSCSRCRWISWRPAGRPRTTASGKCAASSGISRIRR